MSSSGSASSVIPCAAATALPSSTSALTSARRSGRSHTRPCVSPVSAPTGFVAALKTTLRHCAARASATACVGIPPRVQASASRSISSVAAGLGSNGPSVVSPFTSHCTTPGDRIFPAGNVVPRITRATCRAIASSFPTPFCTEATAPSANACSGRRDTRRPCASPSSPRSRSRTREARTARPSREPARPRLLRPSAAGPCALIASTCARSRSYAHTSTSSSCARFAAKSDPTAPQPTTQTLTTAAAFARAGRPRTRARP